LQKNNKQYQVLKEFVTPQLLVKEQEKTLEEEQKYSILHNLSLWSIVNASASSLSLETRFEDLAFNIRLQVTVKLKEQAEETKERNTLIVSDVQMKSSETVNKGTLLNKGKLLRSDDLLLPFERFLMSSSRLEELSLILKNRTPLAKASSSAMQDVDVWTLLFGSSRLENSIPNGLFDVSSLF
jgi:hypothetical protein